MNRILVTMLIGITGLLFLGAAKDWGAEAALSNPPEEIRQMLNRAIEDEYLARAEYRAILKKFRTTKPYTNILKSEERHIEWLADEFWDRGLPIPEDRSTEYLKEPETLAQAYEAGIKAEIDNIAMYEQFLKTKVILKPENRSLRDLFQRLRDASINHRQAFERQLR